MENDNNTTKELTTVLALLVEAQARLQTLESVDEMKNNFIKESQLLVQELAFYMDVNIDDLYNN
jgi:hypothetical protein